MIRLHTLGTLDLRAPDGHEIHSILAQPKRMALLAYLAVHGRQGPVGRNQILALFWPDLDDARARAALSRALHYLRHSLGKNVLLSRGDDAIGCSADAFWCDAAEVESAAAYGSHRRVLELYRGDLLEGFHLPGTSEFERWLDAKRERLRETACLSAWRVAEEERRAGNDSVAAQWGRWAVARAPYDEASVRRLMALLDGSGDRAGAAREFELFAARLANDLELTPSPETRALMESIRTRDAGSPGTVFPRAARSEDTVDWAPPNLAPLVSAPEEAAPIEERPGPEPAEAPGRRRARAAQLLGPARRAAAAALASVLLVAIAVVTPTARATPDGTVILVTSLENRTGDPTFDSVARLATDWIVRGVGDVFESATGTAPLPAARVIRSDEAADEPGPLARRLRAGTVISGELYRERGVLQLRVRVVDEAHGGRVWAISPVSATSSSTEETLREVSQRAAGAVAALMNPTLAEWFPVATSPPTYDALVEYLRAFEAERTWERGEHFERAAQLDTTFTWALLEAAEGGRMLDRGRAHAILTELDAKRGELNRLQTTVLRSHLARDAGDRQAYHEAMAAAARLAPTRFSRQYAMSARDLNLPRQTLELLDRADALRPPSPLPASWMLRADMLHELREYRQELALALRVRALLPRDFSALSEELRAMAGLGRVDALSSLVDSAMSIPPETFYSPGTVMLLAANELRAHGHTLHASRMTRRAIEWYRGSPQTFTKGHGSWHDYYLAHALYLGSQWDEARTLFQKLAEAEPTWRAEFYGRLGAIAAHTGHRAEAEAYLSALGSLDIPNEAQPEEVGLARARIAALLGDRERALGFLFEGYGGGQGTDLHTDPDLGPLTAADPGFKEFARPKG